MRVRFVLVVIPLLGLFLGCGPKTTESTLATPGTRPPIPPDEVSVNKATAKSRLAAIGVALHSYHDAMGQLPGGNRYVRGNLSWRVELLPYLEQDNLFRQFKLDEPWDSEHNKKLIEQMPDVYASPGKPAPAGQTYTRSFVGPAAFLPPRPTDPKAVLNGRKLPASFPDGTSSTLAVAEAAEPVVWTRPDELPFDGKAVPKLGGAFDGGFHGLMADGQVYFFPKEQASDDLLRSMLTIDGKEVVDVGAVRKANGLPERQTAPHPRPTSPTGRASAPPPYTGPKK
jgi:hypothetical protein